MSMIKMKNYPNGYMGKIEYWTAKLNEEVFQKKVPNLYMIHRIHQKLEYFILRQGKVEGIA